MLYHGFLSESVGWCCTCVHLLHAVQEVLRSGGDAVAAQSQPAVCALLPRVIRPAAHTHTQAFNVNSHTHRAIWTKSNSFVTLIWVLWDGKGHTCLLRKGSELLLGMLPCVIGGELMFGATGTILSESMGSCRSATSWRNTYKHCNPSILASLHRCHVSAVPHLPC